MKFTFKTDFDSKKIMSDLKKQTGKTLKSNSYDIKCPHCEKVFSAKSGHNVCPHCRNDVTLNLDINL